MDYYEHKHSKTKQKTKIIDLAICVAAYIVMHVLSSSVLGDVYIFEWMSRNRSFFFGAVIAIIPILFNKPLIAYFATLGTFFGGVSGQLIGDYIREKNLALITSDMSVEQQHFLSYHRGFNILGGVWFGFLVLGVILSVIIGLWKKRKAKTAAE